MNDTMPENKPHLNSQVAIDKGELEALLESLHALGFITIGPTVRDGAVVLQEIQHAKELPIGWQDEQSPGYYRLQKKSRARYFSFAVPSHAWKKFLHLPSLTLFPVHKNNGTFTIEPPKTHVPKQAFIGVKACDLHAIHIQDRVMLGGRFQDPHYKLRRQNAFILALNCTAPGNNCFCSSMGAGPSVDSGFDLALTELEEIFVLEIGSELGSTVVSMTRWRPAGAFAMGQAKQALDEANKRINKKLDTRDLPQLLYDKLDAKRWDQVAARCLSCANCTMVCPTCFCTEVHEASDLTGTHAERKRVWDSCFSLDFSHVHGGNIRPMTRSRYRQWLTHKLASWIDQFGSSGCVGCGRCITWCPVGIDLTEEVEAIRREGKSYEKKT